MQVHGEAGGPGEDAWVRFELLAEGDIVKDARFKVRSLRPYYGRSAVAGRPAGRALPGRSDPGDTSTVGRRSEAFRS